MGHVDAVAFQKSLVQHFKGRKGGRRDGPPFDQAVAYLSKFNKFAHITKPCRLMCLSDATASMDSLWASTQKQAREMIERIAVISGEGNIMMKWVAFRDYDMGEGVIESSEWTGDAARLTEFVGKIECSGGYDFPEAIEMALQHASSDPEPPTRVLLIGDAPAHFEKKGERIDHQPGKPVLTTDFTTECERLKAQDIPVFAFYLGKRAETRDNFREIADMTGGKSSQLKSSADLIDVVCVEALQEIGGDSMVELYKKKKWVAFSE